MEQQRGTGVLLAIAAFKLVKAAVLVGVGFGALRLAHDGNTEATLRRFVNAFRMDPNDRVFNLVVERVSGLDRRKLEELSAGTFTYAGVFLVEGTGLLLGRHWAEYMTTIVTGSFIPLEVFEMIRRPSLLKATGLFLNGVIVAYLIFRLRRERREKAIPDRARQAAP